ncbi:flagellar hook-basal body family protein, partial [Vibrio parahaemolyticus AQ3810]
TC